MTIKTLMQFETISVSPLSKGRKSRKRWEQVSKTLTVSMEMERQEMLLESINERKG